MSLERRKPFALLQAKPTDSVPATNSTPPQPYLSRPRRQIPVAYHHQPHQLYNPPRRYATVLQKSSHSSATSSADSFYSAVSSIPSRRSNPSPVEDMAARVRARWAALEALERTSGAPGPIVTLVDAITATNTDTAENNESINNNDDTVTITTRSTLYNVSRIRIQSHTTTEWRQRQWEEMGKESEKVSEDEISMSMSMQVDEYENILPLRPAPLALAQDIKPCQGPISSGALVPAAPSMVMAMASIMHNPSEENRNGFTSYRDCERAGEFLPTGGSLGTVPTSTWSFKMTESQRHVCPHRPTQALMAPSIRKRPSLTDELEEAREEATLTLLCSSRLDGLLRCPRRGCDELLSGVRALTFHLHIHVIGAGAYPCLRCGGTFDSARELARHACARLKAGKRLCSIFRVWTNRISARFGKEQ